MVWQGSGSCQSVGYVYSMGRRSSRHMRKIDCISFGFVGDDSVFTAILTYSGLFSLIIL